VWFSNGKPRIKGKENDLLTFSRRLNDACENGDFGHGVVLVDALFHSVRLVLDAL